MIKGAIFDQDGLLFDTESVYAKAWVEVSERHGYGFTDAMTRRISGFGRGEIGSEVARLSKIDDVEGYIDEVMVRARELLLAAPPKLKPGAREILEFFAGRGVKMALASSSPRDCIEWNLGSTGLKRYFGAIVAGEDVTHGKPNPDIFLLAAAKLGEKPQDCVVFEDAFTGIQAAVRAGCRAVMIPDRREPDDSIRQIAQVFSSLQDAISSCFLPENLV